MCSTNGARTASVAPDQMSFASSVALALPASAPADAPACCAAPACIWPTASRRRPPAADTRRNGAMATHRYCMRNLGTHQAHGSRNVQVVLIHERLQIGHERVVVGGRKGALQKLRVLHERILTLSPSRPPGTASGATAPACACTRSAHVTSSYRPLMSLSGASTAAPSATRSSL